VSSSAVVIRPGRGARVVDPVLAHERSVRRRVSWAWAMLVLNVLTWAPGLTILGIPSKMGKGITQGALPVAILLLLTVNRRVRVRPSVFLCLATLLVIGAAVGGTEVIYLGSFYRIFRLAEFVAAMWLLTPWWGRRDLLLLRTHLITMGVVLGTVLIGYVVAHGRSMYNGRLNGVIWPIPDPQVAHYAAVTTGLVVVLWFVGLMRGRRALMIVVVTSAILLLTHTRTALIAMLAGIIVAGLSLFAVKSRVRRFFAAAAVTVSIAVTALAGVLTSWLARGQSSSELGNLSGRTQVWGMILAYPRSKFQEIFGLGLSNVSFNGLSIDSNWLASYQTQGIFGVTICVAMLLFVFVAAYFQKRGAMRALALFLVTYCVLASVTEVGFTDASTYLLELTLAASLLVPPSDGLDRDVTLWGRRESISFAS
jgi:hypothetical protein